MLWILCVDPGAEHGAMLTGGQSLWVQLMKKRLTHHLKRII